ncbi:hypothetical protein vseg_018426 [Gypsophila vaccaria]
MWRRSALFHLKTLISSPSSSSSSSISAISKPPSFLSPRIFSTTHAEVSKAKTRIEDVMPIATGHEREELEAELQGKDILEINFPEGPFGTKASPALVRSYYDRRIVGCPGGEGEDEHDVVWFWLEKDKPYECPVCTQYFKLEVVGPGGDPEGHDHDEGEHHH